ncbi:hypothetical protein ABH935_005380 [Catenulispora sp. GAS73]|uniref:hypothetical protein n=1 Tax=Catenulispora sp. GAS73 TaxID=3156269 RepID=UPI0035139A27
MSSPNSSSNLPRDDKSIVRLTRHRIIYDAALAFYAVLTAFVLNRPLGVLGKSLVTSPAGQGVGDWTTRLLTLTLLVQAAIWFHALLASVEKSELRTLENTGNSSSEARRYAQSVVLFWSGVVMVIILMTLGNAVPRGTSDFLLTSFAYVIWSLLSSVLERWMRQDLVPLRKSLSRKESAGERNGDIGAFNILESVALLLLLAGLALWAQRAPAQGLEPFFQALIWLMAVIIAVVVEYFRFMCYYGI